MKKYDIYLKGYVGSADFDSEYVEYILTQKEGKPVSVLINSLGGEVNTAFTIAAAFRRHGDVSVHFCGMNASAATIASMGAKHISIDHSAMYLVHKVSSMLFEYGTFNADQMQQLIEKLQHWKQDFDKVDVNIAEMYAERCKKTPDNLLSLMKEGGWLNSAEAQEWGFVDEVTDDIEPAPALTNQMVASMQTAGIPIPNLPVQNDTSLLTAIKAMLQSIFHSSNKDKSISNNHNNTLTNTMKKVYHNICRILNVKDITLAKDNTAALTDEQFTALDNKIQEFKDKVANQKATINKQAQTIQNLKSAPGANSTAIVNNSNSSAQSEESYLTVLHNARELYNSLP